MTAILFQRTCATFSAVGAPPPGNGTGAAAAGGPLHHSGNGTSGATSAPPTTTTAPANEQRHQQQQQQQQRRLSTVFARLDLAFATKKPFAELRRTRTERKKRAAAAAVLAQQQERITAQQTTTAPAANGAADQLPDKIWARIVADYLDPLDRIHLGQCSKRMRTLCARWDDVYALEIRPDWGAGKSQENWVE